MPAYIDYIKLAEEKGLDFVEDRIPSVRTAKIEWQCNTCGTIINCSYHTLKMRKYGCSCQRPSAKTIQDYHELATKLGIDYLGEVVPPTVRTRTWWLGPSGTPVHASYDELGYNHITRELKRKLGLLGAFNV